MGVYKQLTGCFSFFLIIQYTLNFILRCTGDGNCLYNTASIAVKGDESCQKILRNAVSEELIGNMEYYAKHPYFCILKEKLDLHSKAIFMQAFTDDVVNVNLEDPTEMVKLEAQKNT